TLPARRTFADTYRGPKTLRSAMALPRLALQREGHRSATVAARKGPRHLRAVVGRKCGCGSKHQRAVVAGWLTHRAGYVTQRTVHRSARSGAALPLPDIIRSASKHTHA